MGFLVYISDYIMPLLFFYVIGFGLLMKIPVYDEFVKGAKKGLSTVVSILPTLVGLMMGVGILRASGALDAFGNLLRPAAEFFHFPVELVPLSVVKMFSSSAATGLLLDIYQKYGFFYWKDCFHFYVLHRNHFLYNVSVFYRGKSQQDAMDSAGGFDCDGFRSGGQRSTCCVVDFYKEIKKPICL